MPRNQEGAPPTAAYALRRVLRVGDDAHRFYAAHALGRIRAVESVPDLIEALRDPDSDVRSAAAEALGELGDSAAVAPLLENLAVDPSGDVKVNVVVALGHLRDRRAIPMLRQLVRGRGEDIVWDEEEFLAGGWDDWLDVQLKAIEALARIGASEAVPDILAAMDDPDGQDLSETGSNTLSRLGDAGIDALGGYLDSPSARTRRSAARFLAAEGGGQSARHLLRALQDPLPEVRLIALQALAQTDVHDPALGRCLRDASAAVRAEAVRTCGTIDLDSLDELLDDPDDVVQEAVIERLTRPGTPQPPDLPKRLRVKLRGPSERVAIAAAAQLVQLAPDIALSDLTEQATDKGCPTGLRCAAIDALGTISVGAAIETVTTALADDERRIRITATVVLGRLAAKEPRARKALLDVLGAPTPTIGNDASDNAPPSTGSAPTGDVEDMAPAWPTSTLAALAPAAAPAQPEPTESVDLTEEDLAYLELVDRRARRRHVPVEPDIAKDIDVRRMGARVAGDVADRRIVVALSRCLLDTDAELRRNAADSLTRVATEKAAEIAAIAGALMAVIDNEKDSQVRCLLLRALGAQRGPAVERLLTSLLSDADSFVCVEAIRALARIDCVGDVVEKCLADADPSVRLVAAQAVAQNPTPARIDELIAQAFAFEGQQRHDIGRLLRGVALDEASAVLVSVLLDDTRQREWRIAIEILQELQRPMAASGVMSGRSSSGLR